MSEAEGGPSNASHGAPEHPLPSTPFYSVEFPGYVKDSSLSRALQHLGGQPRLDRAFQRNASKTATLLELNWRPENPFSHPVPGNVINVSNILLKVTKRRRKRRDGAENTEGEFIAKAVGVIPKAVRFRSMADYQYLPEMTDPISQLRSAMDRMDAVAIKNYAVPSEKEDYNLPANSLIPAIEPQQTSEPSPSGVDASTRSNLRLFPPPLFSRQPIPQIYNYKANNMSVVATVIDSETGVEKKRLINKMRWRGYGPASISFSEKIVPTGPPTTVEEALTQADARILALLKQRFEERPVWTRNALRNQFDPSDWREVHNSKFMVAMASYVFSDGPWRDTLLKFGYDPRVDPAARFYQRVYFRNINHPIQRPSIMTRRQESRPGALQATSPVPGPPEPERESGDSPTHIFDGIHLSTETAAYQLCDITDPMLKGMITDEAGVRDECNERDGWYTTHTLERIKAVLRHKFFSLLEGHIATEEECLALLDPGSEAGKPVVHRESRRLRPSKHNMAKGALPPEDAAAARLRATLDSTSKGTTGRGR